MRTKADYCKRIAHPPVLYIIMINTELHFQAFSRIKESSLLLICTEIVYLESVKMNVLSQCRPTGFVIIVLFWCPFCGTTMEYVVF